MDLYGPEVIRPNHHYATHTGEFVLDYGPLREFWTFLFERLNKVLKSYRTNNHEGGEIEMTFFREFHRTARLHQTLTHGWSTPATTSIKATCELMMQATSDNRGTLQQLTKDLDEHFVDDSIALSLSPRSCLERLPTDVYFTFVAWMNTRSPMQAYHSDVALTTNPNSIRVANLATVFDYVVIRGHRYYAASRATSGVNSVALCRVSGAGASWIGQIQHIVVYEDATSGVREMFAHVRWFRPVTVSLSGTPWAACQEAFSLQVWEANAYVIDGSEPGPAVLVALGDILAPVACHVVTLEGADHWLTMPLMRAPIIPS
ncbi:hypothetical protein C2E23DRAFT_845126 [Lenzites betulinus]|nr:hypothetical protein C2E23DRAFT_845126 [Lenzites betulinus]